MDWAFAASWRTCSCCRSWWALPGERPGERPSLGGLPFPQESAWLPWIASSPLGVFGLAFRRRVRRHNGRGRRGFGLGGGRGWLVWVVIGFLPVRPLGRTRYSTSRLWRGPAPHHRTDGTGAYRRPSVHRQELPRHPFWRSGSHRRDRRRLPSSAMGSASVASCKPPRSQVIYQPVTD